MKYKTLQRGLSFVEIILYIAIVTIILSALLPFSLALIDGADKSDVTQEVFAQARFVSERVLYEIRNANGINSVSSSSISLIHPTPSLNPTVIDTASGKARITQGVNPSVNLNSDDTTVSTLSFTNYTSGDNKTKHIRFSVTVDSALPQTRQEYIQSVTLESSAEVRSN